jgi:Leucine-rich repeat (LRR) protein
MQLVILPSGVLEASVKSINPSGSRVELNKGDSASEVNLMLMNSRALKVIQFSEPLPLKLLEALDDDFFCWRPDVELRAYGFYGMTCDLSFCSRMSHVQNFRADCLQSAINVECVARMPRLKSLGIGIFDLDTFEILREINPGLEKLYLSQTKSRKPDLAPIRALSSLRHLCLAGQQKNIEVIGDIQELQELHLISVTIDSLGLLRNLQELWFLRIGLGGTKNLSALRGLANLKYLELWRILGLDDISVIETLAGLQHLFLQDLARITKLPSFKSLPHLRRVTIDSLKALVDISSLTDSPSLEEIVHSTAKVQPEDYLPLLHSGRLKFASAGFGSLKKNEQFKVLCEKMGVTYGVNRDFKIR